MTLSVAVTDPDGRPLEGARVTFTLAAPGVPAVTSKRIQTAGDGSAGVVDDDPQGRDDRPGLVHGHRPDGAIRERDRPDRHQHREVAPASNARAKLAAPCRSAIGRSQLPFAQWPCGGAPTAARPSPWRHGAGFAGAPPPVARRAVTSGRPSRRGSATAGSTAGTTRSPGAEVRSCWEGRPLVLEDEAPPPAPVVAGDAITPDPDELYLSGFVLVDALPVAVGRPAGAGLDPGAARSGAGADRRPTPR